VSVILDRKIWALASGKGGTGKSVIAVSMGAHLADLGFRVVLVDADLGCANLHTCLGIEKPHATLADFIERRTEHIEEVAIDTDIPRLRLISGALDPVDAAHIRYQQKKRIMRQLNTLEADVVILDLATGASLTEVELFCAADTGALIMLPEPTSIENTYRLLRMLYFYMVREIPGFKKLEKKLPPELNDNRVSPAAFLAEVAKIDEKGGLMIQKRMENFAPGLIINQVKTKEDRDLGPEARLVCKRFFGLDLPFLGAVEFDESVWQSVRHKKPVILDYPHSRPSRSIRQLTESMLSLSRRPT
jgi:flagellar biosynthesis protein FlhG